MKTDLAVKKEHKYSNGVCVTLSLYIPSLSLVLVNFYRPPDTTYDEFNEALEDTKKFLQNIERDHNISTITLTGDLNLLFMSDLSEAALESFLGKVQCQERDGNAVADNKKKAVIFIKFLADNFMAQYIQQITIKQQYVGPILYK